MKTIINALILIFLSTASLLASSSVSQNVTCTILATPPFIEASGGFAPIVINFQGPTDTNFSLPMEFKTGNTPQKITVRLDALLPQGLTLFLSTPSSPYWTAAPTQQVGVQNQLFISNILPNTESVVPMNYLLYNPNAVLPPETFVRRVIITMSDN